MALNVLNIGPTLIFTSTAGSTAATGSWWRVHPAIGRIGIHVQLQTASAGATAGSTVAIEGSNSTAAGAMATKLQQFAMAGTTDNVNDGGGFTSSMDRAWQNIRVNMISLTSSTAGSAGSPSINVWAMCSPIGPM